MVVFRQLNSFEFFPAIHETELWRAIGLIIAYVVSIALHCGIWRYSLRIKKRIQKFNKEKADALRTGAAKVENEKAVSNPDADSNASGPKTDALSPKSWIHRMRKLPQRRMKLSSTKPKEQVIASEL